LSKKIIISGRERRLEPAAAFFMSFFITGLGEAYSGSLLQGITLVLIRVVSAIAIPFYTVTNVKSTYLTEAFLSILFFAAVTIFSPVNALCLSLKKKKIVLLKYNTPGFLALFSIFSLVITFIASAVFFSYFSIMRINQNTPPLIEKGDFALIKKTGNIFYNKSEMAILNGGNFNFIRIIGVPGENVSYTKGRFLVQGSELFQSVFTENELIKFSLTDFSVISETQNNLKYPVIQNKDQFKITVNLKDNEYFAAPDDRNNISGFMTVKNENIYGRFEGVLFSMKKIRLLIKPFQDSE